MAVTRQTATTQRTTPVVVMGVRGRQCRLLRTTLVAAIAAGVMAHASLSIAADASTQHRLNPGVRPGDIVIMREVEPTHIRSVDRYAGPITSRANVRDAGMEMQRRLVSGGVVALSDDRAAGVRSTAVSTAGVALRHTELLRTGLEGVEVGSRRAASPLGGGSASGGVAGRVTSATAGIAGSVNRALAPLTGRN
ncbi:hypothetical protein [Halomonas alimentaria]|uniref:Uncharacterized protein n=1 Tax=Halomonas alimentaria TaxID=147248 RepID=A0A7X5ANU9_9GAMM|nr:hypothetical protein [Halomonas alimentaria]NAW33709.1 hypothetical protein [Halomonas alimentaria]